MREHASNPWIQKVPHVGVMRRVSTPVMQAPGSTSKVGLGSESTYTSSTPVVGARGKGVDGMGMGRGLRRSRSPKQGDGFRLEMSLSRGSKEGIRAVLGRPSPIAFPDKDPNKDPTMQHASSQISSFLGYSPGISAKCASY